VRELFLIGPDTPAINQRIGANPLALESLGEHDPYPFASLISRLRFGYQALLLVTPIGFYQYEQRPWGVMSHAGSWRWR
jgi:hypothetical protein